MPGRPTRRCYSCLSTCPAHTHWSPHPRAGGWHVGLGAGWDAGALSPAGAAPGSAIFPPGAPTTLLQRDPCHRGRCPRGGGRCSAGPLQQPPGGPPPPPGACADPRHSGRQGQPQPAPDSPGTGPGSWWRQRSLPRGLWSWWCTCWWWWWWWWRWRSWWTLSAQRSAQRSPPAQRLAHSPRRPPHAHEPRHPQRPAVHQRPDHSPMRPARCCGSRSVPCAVQCSAVARHRPPGLGGPGSGAPPA
mmetsp:Transcript_10592/g.18787  ORF Transcript_10592/g.18787 Transcript_10592/m.18787 type:complete len:244 (-) Transcript_10592:220-951(-)